MDYMKTVSIALILQAHDLDNVTPVEIFKYKVE